MHSVLISLVVFGCTFGGALFGMFLHSILPKEHLQPGTTDVVKLATGLVVTMTGLVLGMLVSSSLTFYNTQHREIQDLSAKLILTDRILSEYGQETREIRSNLHDVVAIAANRIWPEDRSLRTDLKPDHTFANVYGELQALPPKNEQQRTNRAEALGLMRAIYETRWLMFVESSGNALSTPLLTILVSWLTVIFISFGLLGQRNATLNRHSHRMFPRSFGCGFHHRGDVRSVRGTVQDVCNANAERPGVNRSLDISQKPHA